MKNVRKTYTKQDKKKVSLNSGQSSKIYQNFLDRINWGAAVQDPFSGVILEINDMGERLLGLNLKQLQDESLVDPRWHIIDRKGNKLTKIERPASVSVQTGKPIHDFQIGVYHPSKNEYVWLLVNAEPQYLDPEKEPDHILILFTDITESIRVEEKLIYQNKLQKILFEISSTFINLPPGEVDDTINQTIEKLALFFNADRFYVFDYDFVENTSSNTYEWCEKGIEPQIEHLQNFPCDAIPEWVNTHVAGKSLVIPDVLKLDIEDPVRKTLEPQDILSLIAVPIMDGESCIGFVGLDSVRSHRQFNKSDEELLKVFADLLSNLTVRIRSFNEIKEKQSFLSKLIQNSGSIVAVKDLEGKYEVINNTWSEVTGMRIEDVIGKTDFEVFPKRIAEEFTQNDRRAISEDRVIEAEEFLETENGMRYFISLKFPVKNYDGVIKGVCALITENTERKIAEMQLKKSEKRLRKLLESQTNYVIKTNLEGYFIYTNQKYLRDFDRIASGSKLIGSHILDFIVEYHHEEYKKVAQKCKNHPQKTFLVELDSPIHQEKVQTILWEFICFTDDIEGSEIQCMGIDITEQKLVEKERIARREAEASNKAKNTFLSKMSHEIRTPLHAILGFSQILERDNSLNEYQTEKLQTISRSGKHLLMVIDDILDYSKLEYDQVSLKLTNFSIKNLLDDLYSMFQLRAREKDISYSVEISEDMPTFIHADEGKIRQVLVNVIGNAIKFTEIGHVRVSVYLRKNKVESGSVVLGIKVQDTGPGMRSDEQKAVFDEFRQFEAGIKAGGSGLGMTISLKLTEIMNGEINVESTYGEGTTVSMEIPIIEVENTHISPMMKSEITGLNFYGREVTILVVDDNQDNRDTIRELLSPLGIQIVEAVNGKEAVEVFESVLPQLILMDVIMPVMDGYEASELIKKSKSGNETPIIAVTANVLEMVPSNPLRSYIDDYLQKPFMIEELLRVLARWLNVETECTNVYSRNIHSVLTKEDLNVIPKNLLKLLVEALEAGDMDRFKKVVGQIKEIDKNISDTLFKLANKFDYEQLHKILN